MKPAPEDLQAFGLLFERTLPLSESGLACLDVPALKRAFRKTALRTHPDRAKFLRQDPAVLGARFQRALAAYDTLTKLIALRDTPRPAAEPAGTERGSHHPPPPPCAHASTELPIGRFLFRRGEISWNDLIAALVWQRKNRPRYGEILQGWGRLSDSDILRILREKPRGMKFGEYVLDSRMIDPFQHAAVLSRQRRYKRPLGRFFIDNRLLSPNRLASLLAAQRRHNIESRSSSGRTGSAREAF